MTLEVRPDGQNGASYANIEGKGIHSRGQGLPRKSKAGIQVTCLRGKNKSDVAGA